MWHVVVCGRYLWLAGNFESFGQRRWRRIVWQAVRLSQQMRWHPRSQSGSILNCLKSVKVKRFFASIEQKATQDAEQRWESRERGVHAYRHWQTQRWHKTFHWCRIHFSPPLALALPFSLSCPFVIGFWNFHHWLCRCQSQINVSPFESCNFHSVQLCGPSRLCLYAHFIAKAQSKANKH